MGRGKWPTLLATAEEHWPALRFDLLGKVTLPRRPLDAGVPWELVALCVDQLQRDPSSALYGAICDALVAELPDDPDLANEEESEADEINAVLAARMGPIYGLLRRVEWNQRLAMHQQGHEDGAAIPEPLSMPADVLAKVRERDLTSMSSDVAQEYMALMRPPTETG